MSLNIHKIRNIDRHSRSLQDKLTAKETTILVFVFNYEETIARRMYPDLFSNFSCFGESLNNRHFEKFENKLGYTLLAILSS
jgi:hypothetical protein